MMFVMIAYLEGIGMLIFKFKKFEWIIRIFDIYEYIITKSKNIAEKVTLNPKITMIL